MLLQSVMTSQEDVRFAKKDVDAEEKSEGVFMYQTPTGKSLHRHNSMKMRRQMLNVAAISMDSGLGLSTSASSLSPPDLSIDNSTSLQSITESENLLSPVTITIDEEKDVSGEVTKVSYQLNDYDYLSVQRKHSTASMCSSLSSVGSATSEEFTTAPTSPISRQASVESAKSPNSSPEEVKVRVEINFPASKESSVMINTKMNKKAKQFDLKLNIFLTPNTSESSPRRRSYSSPTSAPNSPILSSKKLLPSTSLDRETPPSSPILFPDKRKKHDRIANIIRKNMEEFVRSTDLESLCTHLYTEELLSHSDMESIEGMKNSRAKKNYFYMLLLNTKGVGAYQKLFDCLKAEQHHSGHRDLVAIIDSGLQQANEDE